MIQKRSIKATPHQLKKIYAEVYRRDKGMCQLCRGAVYQDYAFHHIVPKGRIRIDHPDNLSLVHMVCHDQITNHIGITVDEFIEMKKEQLGEFYYYRIGG